MRRHRAVQKAIRRERRLLRLYDKGFRLWQLARDENVSLERIRQILQRGRMRNARQENSLTGSQG